MLVLLVGDLVRPLEWHRQSNGGVDLNQSDYLVYRLCISSS